MANSAAGGVGFGAGKYAYRINTGSALMLLFQVLLSVAVSSMLSSKSIVPGSSDWTVIDGSSYIVVCFLSLY